MLMLLAFLVALAVLIVVHEFGHYQVAKWCGVRVLRFSVGFGKPIYSKVFGKDQTEFVVAGIPLGGYVKMLDEREIDEEDKNKFAQDLHRAFNRQAPLKRIAIVAAGPIANLLLAIFFYWILTLQGVTGVIAKVDSPPVGSAADIAGIKQGDLILSLAGKPIVSWQDLQWRLLQVLPADQPINIQIKTIAGENHNIKLDASKLDSAKLDENIMQNLGFSLYQPDLPAVIGEIQAKSVAEKARLRLGDKIISIDGLAIKDWKSLVEYIRSHPNKSISMEILRDEKLLVIQAVLDQSIEKNSTIGRLGVGPSIAHDEVNQMLVTRYYKPLDAMAEAINKTWQTSVFSLKMLFKMISGHASLKTISGPVTIANFAGQSAHLGWKPYLAFLAILSISLGVLNLLPVPILDGGHIVYYTVEIIRGRPLSESVMMVGQKVGFVILGALMLLALYNDFDRLLTGSF